MATSLPCPTTRLVTVEELLDHLRNDVDARDVEQLGELAPLLGGLVADRELIVRPLNEQFKRGFTGTLLGHQQSITLAVEGDFHLHANIWPSTADIAAGRVSADPFSYDNAHDHNFHFLSTAYFGTGYIADVYEYNYERIEGYIGEPVDLRFQERIQVSSGVARLYQASRDVHIQFPPEDLSISLSLMAETPELRARDQFFFDLQHRVISGFAPYSDTSRRVDLVAMAGSAGNAESCQILSDLARSHPCRRTRLTAYESLARLLPGDAMKIWERACDDPEALVSNEARGRLAVLQH